MSIINYIWKVWLKLNLLTRDVDNDYVAEVSTNGRTLRNEDIARLLVESRSEYRYETILSILHESEEIICHAVQQGSIVLTGTAHYAPRVKGNWIGANAPFDPKVHKLTVDMTPGSHLREALTHVGVEVLGIKNDGAYIGLVTDLISGTTDGVMQLGDDIAIEGNKIKIAPANDAAMGVFLVLDNGDEIPMGQPLQNDPKKIIIRIREQQMPHGTFTLRIITRFSNSSTLLKEPRKIDYPTPIVVQ